MCVSGSMMGYRMRCMSILVGSNMESLRPELWKNVCFINCENLWERKRKIEIYFLKSLLGFYDTTSGKDARLNREGLEERSGGKG